MTAATPANPRTPSWPIQLSILAALATIGLKFFAYFLTGSVSLFSDALESIINLVAAVLAYVALWYSHLPPDEEHTYGHEKISYFSSGVEGMLILLAAVSIAWHAVTRLLDPIPLARLDVGLLISLAASAINFVVAMLLLRVGRRHRSIILEADGHHLMSDVWTSVGVLAALALVWLFDWHWLDPVVALAVAAFILWTGLQLLRRSFDGLMDRAWPKADLDFLKLKISDLLRAGMAFHALRTRTSGTRRLLEFHLLVPGSYSVKEAHAFSHHVEEALRRDDPNLDVTIHIEPIEEATSWGDHELVRFEKT
jgi:cation diffusion facilitator family transporter